ncbi:hypothetical protein FIBSPDRAFT_899273 [Athelia psychrophila]|uniref:Uncharacterized protein n=1 Tax=Athelia psychrophila TaxID=1759441 RepID=A0A165ZXG6_9AGAM|nr:hypothetical protein FIBSPDRAFT_899273 [Fibularhizoctonia sp. CBS 109695]
MYQEFCDAFAAATSLTHLWAPSLSSPIQKLPSLRTLIIGSCHGPEGQFVGLLHTVTAPLLGSLVLEGFIATNHLLRDQTLPISKFPGLKWLVLRKVDAPLSTFAEHFGSVQNLDICALWNASWSEISELVVFEGVYLAYGHLPGILPGFLGEPE